MHKNTSSQRFIVTLAMGALLSCLLVACSGDTPPAKAAGTITAAAGIVSGTMEITMTSATKSAPPLTAIRMIDSANGWALTNELILRTANGGHTWHNVTPAGITLNVMAMGNFLNSQIAWIAIPNENASVVTILRTSDGGQHWSSSSIHVPYPAGLDMPHFIGLSEGWIEIITNGGPGAGSESADIWHTTDGGANWQRIASTDTGTSGLTREGFKSGISFRDVLNGWATTSSDTGRPQNPGLYVTHDGGKTWQIQPLSYPPGQPAPQQMGTTPPVFFGNTGILPVHITLPSIQQELVLYVTYDGGKSWVPTTPAYLDFNTVYVIDPQHAWASATLNDDLVVTSNGGRSWQHTKSNLGIIKAFSFPNPGEGWAITSTALLQKNKDTSWHTISYTIE